MIGLKDLLTLCVPFIGKIKEWVTGLVKRTQGLLRGDLAFDAFLMGRVGLNGN
jgi:hypothetical protein